MGEKINPFIEIPQVQLYPGEVMIPLNPYTNEGYIIKPYYYVTNFGRFFSIATGRLEEKAVNNVHGYGDVQIITDHGQKHLAAHRGVMASFCPVPNMYELEVDHIYGNTMDNKLWMLAWKSHKKNVESAYEHKLVPPRKRLINDDMIIKIIDMAKHGYSDNQISKELSKEIKIAPETVRFVRTGKEIYGDILENLGLKPILRKEHTNITKQDYDNVATLYEQGKDAKEIAEELDLVLKTVRTMIFRMYGDRYHRKESKVRKEIIPNNSPKKKDPFVILQQEYIDQKVELYPINIHTSNKYIIKSWYAITKDGRVFSMGRGNQWVEMRLRCDEHTNWYKTVGLVTNKGTKQFMVHRLVMSTFDPRPNMYELEVDHEFGDKNDNNFHHLKWVDHSLNMINAAKNGITAHKKSQRAPDEDIIKINELAWSGKSDDEIVELMDNKYSKNNVKIIRAGEKTYGPVLENLCLSPFRYIRNPYDSEDKEYIFEFIESMKDDIGLMESYKKAAEKFGGSSESIRSLYYKMRQK